MQTQLTFNGADYVHHLDFNRLNTQMGRIFELMKDSQFRTLSEIEALTGYPQASISAQLRNLKKQKFGGHRLYKRRKGNLNIGLYEYQLIVNQ
jgi:predicted transcriptional regulator